MQTESNKPVLLGLINFVCLPNFNKVLGSQVKTLILNRKKSWVTLDNFLSQYSGDLNNEHLNKLCNQLAPFNQQVP